MSRIDLVPTVDIGKNAKAVEFLDVLVLVSWGLSPEEIFVVDIEGIASLSSLSYLKRGPQGLKDYRSFGTYRRSDRCWRWTRNCSGTLFEALTSPTESLYRRLRAFASGFESDDFRSRESSHPPAQGDLTWCCRSESACAWRDPRFYWMLAAIALGWSFISLLSLSLVRISSINQWINVSVR